MILSVGLARPGPPSAGAGLLGWTAAVTVAFIALVAGAGPDPLGSIHIALMCSLGFLYASVVVVVLAEGRWRGLSPIAVFIYCHGVLFFGRPVYGLLYQGSRNIFDGTVDPASALQAQLIAGAGLLSTCVGYAIVRRRTADRAVLRHYSRPSWKSVSVLLALVAFTGVALFLVYVRQIGFATYFGSFGSGRSTAVNEFSRNASGYTQSGLQFAVGAVIVALLQYLATDRKRAVAGTVLGLVLLTLPQIVTGSRSTFIPLVVSLLAAIAVVRPGALRGPIVLATIPLIYIFGIVAPRIYRVDLADGGTLAGSIGETFTAQSLVGDFLGGLDTAMLDAFVLQIRAQETVRLPLSLGETYLGAAGAVVPRALWPNKPGTVDQYLNAVLFPLTNAKGIGFSFGIYSEPYLNFGLIGVVVVMAAFGAFLALLTNWALRSGSPLALMVYVITAGTIFPLVRGSLSFDSQRSLIEILPAAAVLLIHHVLFERTPLIANSTVSTRSRRKIPSPSGSVHSLLTDVTLQRDTVIAIPKESK